MAKKSISNLEAKGPTQGEGGYNPSALPSNPSDAIFQGGSLPTIAPQMMTLRRPFSEATRPPLHYLDGPGPDEAVTSRSPHATPILGNAHSDLDHCEERPIQGQPVRVDPDTSRTTNGVEIRGT